MTAELIRRSEAKTLPATTVACPNCAHEVPLPNAGRTTLKTIFVLLMMALSGFYLLDTTMGIDLIPDNIPFFGNLDDATAAAIFFGGLRYFGLDWLPFRLPVARK
jgi:hypothetical protein